MTPMERQFTATAVILKDDKTLLILHRKSGTWQPPGGHIDPNETPPEAAIREAFEETGLEVALIPQENIWINNPNAKSIERPYVCFLEEIPAYQNHQPHQHIDMIYLARPVSGTEIENARETAGIRWFTLHDIENLKPNVEIYAELQVLLRHLLAPV